MLEKLRKMWNMTRTHLHGSAPHKHSDRHWCLSQSSFCAILTWISCVSVFIVSYFTWMTSPTIAVWNDSCVSHGDRSLVEFLCSDREHTFVQVKFWFLIHIFLSSLPSFMFSIYCYVPIFRSSNATFVSISVKSASEWEKKLIEKEKKAILMFLIWILN